MRRQLLEILAAAIERRKPAAVVTRLTDGSQALVVDDGTWGDLELTPSTRELVQGRLQAGRSGGLHDNLFVRIYSTPARLVLVGAVHIAQALESIAAMTGFDVIVVDPRTAFANCERFPNATLHTEWPDTALARVGLDARSALVTLTHDPKLDDPALLAALGTDAFFIGALGSRKSHATRLQRLRKAGATDSMLERIHAPVGIPLGGRTPAEVALSILAQVVQSRHRGSAA